MNEEMVRRWNSVVKPEDTVYYLGDFSLAKRPVELFAKRLNGEKYLIMGNHDPCHPIHKKRAEPSRRIYYDCGFKALELEQYLEISGQRVLLHHMPYISETVVEYRSGYKPPKHLAYRPKDEGLWLIHGHVHEKWKISKRMINVGVDVWDFYPVPLEEIEKLMVGS